MFRVMIVDDDKSVIDCLSQLIPWREIGCTLISSAVNGLEGYNLAVEQQPDLIICDIIMPVMDGATLCRRVYETMSDVTFIFLSAYEDFTTAQIALQYHARDYILKPINRSKIDYITSLLHDLSVQHEKNAYYMRLLHDSGTEAGIRRALGSADTAFFESLFQRLTDDVIALKLDVGQIRNVVCRLLNLLYSHLAQSRPEIDYAAERAEAFRQLNDLKFKMDMIFLVSERYFQLLRSDAGGKPDYWGALAAQAAAYIDAHFCDSALTASSVAAHFNYSADYLGRLFSQACHETLAAYIGEKRVACAARLLIETRLSVNDVAAQCGYQSASYFARAFKKRFTLSPSDYRAINAPDTKG